MCEIRPLNTFRLTEERSPREAVEEAEEDKRLQKEKRKRKADLIETMQIIGIAGGGVLAVFLICFTLLTIWVR